MQKFAIIVAGGSGTRMQSELPKQFIKLKDEPILMHTIRAFSFEQIQVIVVLPESQIAFWNDLCQKQAFFLEHQVVAGGNTRFESVKNGLNSIKDLEGLVAIHDGVRPIITKDIILQAFEEAEKHGNAIVSVALKDSIREIQVDKNQAKDRSNYRLIQTPQTFQLQPIKKAFDVDYQPGFTDDASVFEFAGHSIHLIEGDYKNIKITTPEDLVVAESFLEA